MFEEEFNWRIKVNLLSTSELIKLLRLFESNIKVVPLAGPVLTYQLYKNLALKSDYRIDLVIDEKDALKAKEILLSQGYELKYEPEINKESAYIKSVREYIFIDDRGLLQVNIKWNYLKDVFSTPVAIKNILDYKKLKSISFHGLNIINPSFEDLFLILCINGAKHQWTRLIYICDMAELVRNTELNWKKIFKTAEKFHLKRILLINLYLIQGLLGITLPHHVKEALNQDRYVIPIAIYLIKKLFSHTDDLIKMRREGRVNLKLGFNIRENKLDGIKDLANNIVFSNSYDKIRKPFRSLTGAILNKYPAITFPEPYVLTPRSIIVKMLQLAEIGPDDIVYDLGCGDGRIVITAAKEFGVKGVGIDLDPKRIKESQNKAEKEGVEDLTTFIEQDIMKADISMATIVTMYHLPSINLMIRPKLQNELKSNTRVVTREFSMGEWNVAKSEIVSHKNLITPIYLYKI